MKIIQKDLTKKSNIRTNSFTKYYCEPNSIDDIKKAIKFSEENCLEIQILGDGTNILFSRDNYYNKLFIKLKSFNNFRIENNIVEIGGSHSLMKAGNLLTKEGYRDFIFMCLIPGSLGGAVRQNAGTTNEGEIKDTFLSCDVYDIKNNNVKTFSKENMKFSYRNSVVQEQNNRFIVLSAKFELKNRTIDIEKLKNFIKEKKTAKINKEPKGYTFGSTFKSHLQEKAAWWYIDHGFKEF